MADDIKNENYKKDVEAVTDMWREELEPLATQLDVIIDKLDQLRAIKDPGPDDKKLAEELKRDCAKTRQKMEEFTMELQENLLDISWPGKLDDKERGNFRAWVKDIIKKKGIGLSQHLTLVPDLKFDFKKMKPTSGSISLKWDRDWDQGLSTCQHCNSVYEQDIDGCCPVCAKCPGLPESETDVPFPLWETEVLFQRTCAIFLGWAQYTPVRNPFDDYWGVGLVRRLLAPLTRAARSPAGRWVWFAISLVLFALVLLSGNASARAVAIVLALLLHELGHYLGMRCFGYHDARIFFIPMFGATTSGWKVDVPPWQQAVVLLLGPLPGLVAGCLLWLYVQDRPLPLLNELALWLIALNLLNLLPLEPLDGGQLINLLLFYREPLLEGLTILASAVCLGGVALVVLESPVLLMLTGLLLVQTPERYRTARAARIICRHWPGLPLDQDLLTVAQLRDLFKAVLRSFPEADRNELAGAMAGVLERAAVPPPGLAVRAVLLSLYAGAVWFTFYTGAAATLPSTVFPPRPAWLHLSSEQPSEGPTFKDR